jgi:prefoldin subunit 5
MAFTVSDFHDLVELLEQYPQWRQELRRLVLTDELLDLPRVVRELSDRIAELVEAQKRAEARLDRVEARLDRIDQQIAELVEAQKRTDEKIAELVEAQKRTDEKIAELVEAQKRTDEKIAELVEAQNRTEGVVAELVISQRQMSEDIGTLKGFAIEQSFRARPLAWYGKILRRPHVLTDEELADLLEPALERGLLTDEQFRDLSLADAVVSGRLKTDDQPVYLIVEVSWGVGESDLRRAMRRAEYLAKAGVRAHPALGGRWIIPQVKSEAESVRDIHLIEWKGELAELFG